LKLTCLHVRITYAFLATTFRVGLLPNLRLANVSMKKNTLIKHKEVVVVCKESGPSSLSYNVLLITPKANIIVKLIVPIVTTKSTLTCTNYGKTDHSVETYHYRKKEVLVVPTTIIKST